MKIGILTFHYAYNYGAVLQAYATQMVLEEMGHDVEFINYQNNKITWNYKRLHFKWNFGIFRNLSLSISNFFRNNNQIRKESKYNAFISGKLNVSNQLFKEGDMVDAQQYDAIVIGSDQVWNPNLTGCLDKVYFGEVGIKPNTKVIAWSPSSLNTEYTPNELKQISTYLKNFTSISVRDESLKEIIKHLTNKEITITLDPTFVLKKDYWLDLCHEVPENNYILIYAVRHFEETMSIAKKMAKANNKTLVVIRSIVNPVYHSHDRNTCSPEDFLSYFYHADFIVCSSFHGTAFSIIFEKNFLNFIPSKAKDSRVRTVLNALGLGDRIVDEKSHISTIPNQPNYLIAEKKLKVLQQHSIEFLKSSLR